MQNLTSSQSSSLSESNELVVVPTRVDIRLPFAPESEKTASEHPEDTNKIPQVTIAPFVVAAGTVIGEYVLEEKIGQGGMGEIWRGVQPLIGKQVAIKFLRGKMATDSDSVERFIREAKAVNAIKHKALIDIFSFGDLPDGRPYFVMEYLQGQSLLSYIAARGPLPWSEILEIFTQLCEALEATHQQGIIHRDLKSENLFLVQEPNKPFVVKVLDFGLAKLIDPEQENAQLTQDGIVFGTPSYMAPEQCKGSVTHLSDIYSLGVILFETITGRTPFFEPGIKATEVMLRHVGEPAPAPSARVSGRVVPAEVDTLVLRVLAKEPSERPANCGAFGVLLREVLEPLTKTGSESISAKPVFLSESQRRSALQTKSTPWGLLAVGAVMVAVAGFAAYEGLRKPPPVPASAPTSIQIKEVIKTVAATAPAHPTTIRLVINSTPEGAEVFLGGVLLGPTPLDKEIPYGEQALPLLIKKEGYQTLEDSFTPDLGSKFPVSLQRLGSKNKSSIDRPKSAADDSSTKPEDTNTGGKKKTSDIDLAPDPFKEKP